MPPLHTVPLPLPPNGLPSEFGYSDRALSQLSTTTAFDTRVEQRDCHNGTPCCVVCGNPDIVERCHIVPKTEGYTWAELKQRKYIPANAKSVAHEPRNGLIMCTAHHKYFDGFYFFIRYDAWQKAFIFINWSDRVRLRKYHGKFVRLNIDHWHAPFPALFLIHEQRVRGFWPFINAPHVHLPLAPQTWILRNNQDMLQSDSSDGSSVSGPPPLSHDEQSPAAGTSSRQTAPGTVTTLLFNPDIVMEILSATRKSASWKQCVQEGTSWEGTADENIAKYKELIDL